MFNAPTICILDILEIVEIGGATVDGFTQNAVPTIFCCSLNAGEGTTIVMFPVVVSTINWHSNLFIIKKLDLDITPFNITLD